MADPATLLRLDRIASRYGTDPWSVLEWDPARLALAIACMDQAMATFGQEKERAGGIGPLPVVVVGRLG